MWTTENHPRCNRDEMRYPSDLTDEEWSLIEPLIPPANRTSLMTVGSRRVKIERAR
jgi:transposase